MISKLQVRPGKTVYDDKGNVLGMGGVLLELDAPIRESDRGKVVLMQIGHDESAVDADASIASIVSTDDDAVATSFQKFLDS